MPATVCEVFIWYCGGIHLDDVASRLACIFYTHRVTCYIPLSSYCIHVCNSEFERSACELLTELYKINHNKTKKLVTRPLETWNGAVIFKLADDFDSMDIKTHDAFQAKLDDIWRGELLLRLARWKVGTHTLSFIIHS